MRRVQGGVWRSAAGGKPDTWEQVGTPEMKGSINGDIWDYGWSGVMDIVTDPLHPGWVYAAVFGSGKGLYRSQDKGNTWEKLLTDNFLRNVAISPVNSDVIYAASSKPLNSGGYDPSSHGVMRSTDGGQTWTPVNEGLSWPFASEIEIDPVHPASVMIASPGEGCNVRNFVSPGPERYALRPTGEVSYGSSTATLSLNTDVVSTCRFAVNPGTAYEDMPEEFQTGDGVVHTFEVTGLSDGELYSYYCKCRDEDGNTNGDDYAIAFQTGTDPTSISSSAAVIPGITVTKIPGGEVRFFISGGRPGDFILQVFDMTGRPVWTSPGSFDGNGTDFGHLERIRPRRFDCGKRHLLRQGFFGQWRRKRQQAIY